jgi:AhpD family alkylhydroperoxidase
LVLERRAVAIYLSGHSIEPKANNMTKRLESKHVIPGAMRALYGVRSYLDTQTSLSKAMIDLVFLRTSQINGCAHCIDMHSRDLLQDGMDVEKLVLVPVWREVGELFHDLERAALAWTETVTNVAATQIPDSDYQSAASVFAEKDLADLTVATGLMNTYNRLGVAFRLPVAASAAHDRKGPVPFDL